MSLHKMCSQDLIGVPADKVNLRFDSMLLDITGKISDSSIEEGDEIEVFENQSGC